MGLAGMLVAIDILNRPRLQTNYSGNLVSLDDGSRVSVELNGDACQAS